MKTKNFNLIISVESGSMGSIKEQACVVLNQIMVKVKQDEKDYESIWKNLGADCSFMSLFYNFYARQGVL